MQPTPGQKRALRSIHDKSTFKLHLGILASLKGRGWIQLAVNADPMGMATSYVLTRLGQKALGLHDTILASCNTNPIGLEAEICEECGGAGQLLILDEKNLLSPCPWCHGTGRIMEILSTHG